MTALYLVGVWTNPGRDGRPADHHHYITASDPVDAETQAATRYDDGAVVRCLGTAEALAQRTPSPTPEFEPDNNPHIGDEEDREVWAARLAEGAPDA